MDDTTGTFTIQGKSHIKMMGIKIDIDCLKAMIGNDNVFGCTKKFLLNERHPLAGWQRTVANQIFTDVQCGGCTAASALFLQGKGLELLARQIAELTENAWGKSNISLSLTPDEVQKIHKARAILENAMGTPPTLKELAARVNLGINKLKNGFKAVHKQTPYLCLHEARMSKAHELLAAGTMNVSQVAWEVGYTNVGHFSAAFYKQFGTKPKEFQMMQTTL